MFLQGGSKSFIRCLYSDGAVHAVTFGYLIYLLDLPTDDPHRFNVNFCKLCIFLLNGTSLCSFFVLYILS